MYVERAEWEVERQDVKNVKDGYIPRLTSELNEVKWSFRVRQSCGRR